MSWSPARFFSPLGLIALVWLCALLQWRWPAPHRRCPTPPEPPPPPPKRHRAPPPFAGRAPKPHGDAWGQERAPRPQALAAPPPRLVMTRGRRRQSDTRPFPAPIRTGVSGLGGPGSSPRPRPVHWGGLAPTAGRRLSPLFFSRPLVHSCMASAWPTMQPRSRPPSCVPLSLRISIGSSRGHHPRRCRPTMGRGCSWHAASPQGHPPKSRWMPLPQLLDAQVVQTVRQRRLVRVSHRVVFGAFEAVQRGVRNGRLADEHGLCGAPQPVDASACGGHRRTGQHAGSGRGGLRQPQALDHTYDHFCFPHARLRPALPPPEPTPGRARPRHGGPGRRRGARGRRRVWTLRAVWVDRVPPWPELQML